MRDLRKVLYNCLLVSYFFHEFWFENPILLFLIAKSFLSYYCKFKLLFVWVQSQRLSLWNFFYATAAANANKIYLHIYSMKHNEYHFSSADLDFDASLSWPKVDPKQWLTSLASRNPIQSQLLWILDH